jgi:hypothetical protein
MLIVIPAKAGIQTTSEVAGYLLAQVWQVISVSLSYFVRTHGQVNYQYWL